MPSSLFHLLLDNFAPLSETGHDSHHHHYDPYSHDKHHASFHAPSAVPRDIENIDPRFKMKVGAVEHSEYDIIS